ncbi:MAG: AAA family ATPase, partial [Algicola sp.]|nr:AAA family ATPase [Algicola sp.]
TELAQLNRFIDSEHTDSLHAAHIHGEAGIGKSRLMFELTDRAQHYTHSMAQCLPEQQNSALFPVFTLLKFQYNLHQLPCEQGIKLLSQAIDTSGQPTMVKHMSILISWLEWPLPQNMVASTLAPSQQRGWLFNILTALLCSQDAGYASVAKLFIFEDLHWADPTTQAFIAHLLKHDLFTRANHRLLITSRQPLPSVFNELAITELKLAKLKPDEAQQYIEALFDRQPLCGDLCQLILARTDGIPLFIEQLVKMMQQQNIVHMLNGQIELARADLASSLPANLRDSLQQKLDNLLYGKETAQLCAVIGRSFDYQLLQQASSHSASQVQLDITQLLDHEIIYQQRKVAGDHYIFRHALIKDAAYDSIPAATRQKMHLRLAQTIESKFAAMTKQSPQIIANHWSKAQQADKASHRYIQAAKKAQANYANDETIYYYQQAIDHLPADNLSPCQHRSVAQAFEGMSDSEMANGEHQKGRQALKNALGFVGENSLAAAEIYYKTGLSWGVNQQHEQALDAYRQAQECIADEPAPTDNNTAHWWNCWFNINSARLNIYYWKNDTDTMARLISLSSALVDKHGNDEQKANFIHDQLSLALRQQRFVTNTTQVAMAQRAQAMISSLQDIAITAKFELNTGLVLYCNGQYQSCYRQMSKALVSALKTNNIPFQTLCSTYMTVVLRQQNDVTQAGEYAERTLKIAQKAGMINYIAAAKANLAWIALRRGQNDEATILTNECLAMWQQQDADNLYPIQWLGLFVQLEITTKKSAGSETAIQQSQIAIINKLMDSKQQKLPTAIEQHLERYRVFDERDNSNTQCRRQIVSQILHQANKLGYL